MLASVPPPLDYEYAVERITRFLRWAVEKSGTRGVVLGLSGGVDSSTTAALAVKALGAERVHVLLLPDSATTPTEDVRDAEELAESLGVKSVMVEIRGIYESVAKAAAFYDEKASVANGNLRARIRMILLYYYANLNRLLVCGASDKSELLLGYYTKYGDGAADILPLADVYKTQVRVLARRLGLPEKIAGKPSSPRLWPGQMAEAELGASYEEIDPVLYLYVELGKSVDWIVKKTGIAREKVEAIVRRVHANEHKRMPPPIARVSKYSVGKDWVMPWNLG